MKKRKYLLLILAAIIIFTLTGCTEADRVRGNISKEADNFNVVRRLAVINTIDGKPLFELIGKFSVTYDDNGTKLTVIVEDENGDYKKHIIGLNEASTMFVVEDISGANVSKYKYEINFLPEMIQPFTITQED